MNLKLFKKRLKAFYSSWRKYKQELWGGSDILVISTHNSDSCINLPHPISSAFYIWLLGYDFPDTIVVFTLKEIYFVCPKKKASLLKPLGSVAMEAVDTPIFIHEKAKGDNGYALLDEILWETRVRCTLNRPPIPLVTMIKHKNENHPIVLGCISGESPRSKLLWAWSMKQKPKGYEIVHIENGLSRLFTVRDRKDRDEKSLMAVSSDKDSRDEPGKVRLNTHREKDYMMDSRACGINLHMQVLPKEVEDMLSLVVEKKAQLKETMIPKLVKIKDELKEKVIPKPEEETPLVIILKDNSPGNSSLGSDENDDWVLVEADE